MNNPRRGVGAGSEVKGLDAKLTQAIIATLREPIIILDERLCVIAANRAFYDVFNVEYEEVQGKIFFELGNGEWDIPALRVLLEQIIPEKKTVKEYEVEHRFERLGQRTMVINARQIIFDSKRRNILLAITDITAIQKITREKELLMAQKDNLLKEMRHRIANSLQLIASIILLKAGSVKSEESRTHLEDAYERIISIATVQRNLDPTTSDSKIPVVTYLTTLCDSISKSMIGGRKPIVLTVAGDSGLVTADDAISLGLLTTELTINALKHAFPTDTGKVLVTFESKPEMWRLTIADDGIGFPTTDLNEKDGLGTSIVESLVNQLGATVERKNTSPGATISITHLGVGASEGV